MSTILKYGIIEDIHTVRRIRAGSFWGVTLLITPITWLGPFVFVGLYFLLHIFDRQLSFTERFYQAIIFAIAVEVATIFHAFGHILSGKLVHSCMDEVLITTTRDVNIYHGDQSLIPGHIHLARSLGGPLFNLLIAGVLLLLGTRLPQNFFFDLNTSLVSINLFFGIGSFFPVPSVDGEVIWREILRFIRKNNQ